MSRNLLRQNGAIMITPSGPQQLLLLLQKARLGQGKGIKFREPQSSNLEPSPRGAWMAQLESKRPWHGIDAGALGTTALGGFAHPKAIWWSS